MGARQPVNRRGCHGQHGDRNRHYTVRVPQRQAKQQREDRAQQQEAEQHHCTQPAQMIQAGE